MTTETHPVDTREGEEWEKNIHPGYSAPMFLCSSAVVCLAETGSEESRDLQTARATSLVLQTAQTERGKEILYKYLHLDFIQTYSDGYMYMI